MLLELVPVHELEVELAGDEDDLALLPARLIYRLRDDPEDEEDQDQKDDQDQNTQALRFHGCLHGPLHSLWY